MALPLAAVLWQFTMLDWALVTVVGLSGLVGLSRGVVREVTALLLWVVTVWLAYRYAANLAALPVVQNWVRSHILALVLVVFAMVTATFLMSSAVTALMDQLVRLFRAETINKAMGLNFGLLRGTILAMLLVAIGANTLLGQQLWWQQAQLVAPLQELAAQLDLPWLFAWLDQWFFDEGKLS